MAGDNRCRSSQYLCTHLGLLRDTPTGRSLYGATLPVRLLHHGGLPRLGRDRLGSLLGRTLCPMSLPLRPEWWLVYPRIHRAHATLPHPQYLRRPDGREEFTRGYYGSIADAECLRLGNRSSQGQCRLFALLLHPALSDRAIYTSVSRDLRHKGEDEPISGDLSRYSPPECPHSLPSLYLTFAIPLCSEEPR